MKKFQSDQIILVFDQDSIKDVHQIFQMIMDFLHQKMTTSIHHLKHILVMQIIIIVGSPVITTIIKEKAIMVEQGERLIFNIKVQLQNRLESLPNYGYSE